MKRLLITSIIFSILMLTAGACAPVPTATSTTSAPSETPSPIPSETPTTESTSTPTEAPAPAAESDLKPVHAETITGELLGVKMTTILTTDGSLDPTITAIKINDHYTNSEGKNSQEALTEFTARTFYKVWLKKGGVDGTGPGTDVSFEDYMTMWAKAQTSGLEADWREVQITIKANDVETEGYEPVPTVIWPMYSGTAPEDVRAINEFDIAFVKGKKVKNITIVDQQYSFGYGTNLIDNKLSIYITPITDEDMKNINNLLRCLVTIPSWLTTNKKPSSFENSTISDIIATEVNNIKVYRSALQIFPSGSVDQQYNP